jgi:hypothetical protein
MTGAFVDDHIHLLEGVRAGVLVGSNGHCLDESEGPPSPD